MKALNPLRYIAEAADRIADYKARIGRAEEYEKARNIGNAALGYIDCMITFLNTMIDLENNDFTGDLDEVLEIWHRDVCQAVIDKAIETHQDHDKICRLLKIRDNEENE